jgi:hypothetical protein
MGIASRRTPEGALAGFSLSTRVAVFIDWQNCFRSAQDAFGPGTNGNVNPLALARHLAADRAPGQPPGQLVHVDVHSGVPSQQHDSKSFAARMAQHAAWSGLDACLTVFPRSLAYRFRQGLVIPQEKGIDVAVAVGMVRRSLIDGSCDVTILVSADTDLLPALDLIAVSKGATSIEVAAWAGPFRAPQPLALQGHQIRQHRLDQNLYRAIEDTTDYTLSRRQRRHRP